MNALPRPLPDPPRVLTFVIDGEPTPAQLGVRERSGRVTRSPRVKSYRDHCQLLAFLAARRIGWEAIPSEAFDVTLRVFVGSARTIDGDNIAHSFALATGFLFHALIAKTVLDAIKGPGRAFPDDKQVAALHVLKRIDRERPRVEVTIERLGQ